ncbi:Protein of unknown function [Pyronema omphalodes CBS 100304]|uniref:Uncharacterized protein n=1 Tax=Pyronema omphalodes (strain CBS 100304) TaxID=1076935 RepID=U4LUI2_PYROM|nr:Protein of unknown function [Pyronema omphalodes CBS 100304]
MSPTTQNNKPFRSYYGHESRYYTAQTPATVFTQTSSVVVFSSGTSSVVVFSSGSSSSQQLSPFTTPESTSTQDTANTTLERGSYAEAATQTVQSQGYANACTQTTPPPPDHRYRRSTTPYSPAPGYLSRAPSSRPGGSSNSSARGHPLARTPPWRKPNNEGYYRRWERPADFGESSRGLLGPPYERDSNRERDRNRERDGDWNELRRWRGGS